MSELYNRIEALCVQRGVNITQMCRQSGAPRGSLTDLKNGRTAGLTAKTLEKIADYFELTIGQVLGKEQKKTPGLTLKDGRLDDKALMFSLWGDSDDVDEEDLDDVRRYAAFVRERKKEKK